MIQIVRFLRGSDDWDRFEIMFPDSEIAKSFCPGETKIKNIQFGLVLYIKECFLYEISNFPFSFKFNETKTWKAQKQYDEYAQYWSKKSNSVENHYFGSLFVGHGRNEDLLEHFEHFISEMQCKSSYFLHLGMNGLNVNFPFQTTFRIPVTLGK